MAKAAQRYRNTQLSLNFSADSKMPGGNQSIEDEMKHYENSIIPLRSSTDMIGYWVVRPCVKLTASPMMTFYL
jgi:hypothetical protein